MLCVCALHHIIRQTRTHKRTREPKEAAGEVASGPKKEPAEYTDTEPASMEKKLDRQRIYGELQAAPAHTHTHIHRLYIDFNCAFWTSSERVLCIWSGVECKPTAATPKWAGASGANRGQTSARTRAKGYRERESMFMYGRYVVCVVLACVIWWCVWHYKQFGMKTQRLLSHSRTKFIALTHTRNFGTAIQIRRALEIGTQQQ